MGRGRGRSSSALIHEVNALGKGARSYDLMWSLISGGLGGVASGGAPAAPAAQMIRRGKLINFLDDDELRRGLFFPRGHLKMNIAVLRIAVGKLEMAESELVEELVFSVEELLDEAESWSWTELISSLRGCEPVLEEAARFRVAKRLAEAAALHISKRYYREGAGDLRSGMWWWDDVSELDFSLVELLVESLGELKFDNRILANFLVYSLAADALVSQKMAVRGALEIATGLLSRLDTGSLPPSSLFVLLRIAVGLDASMRCREGIEWMIGVQFHRVNLEHLISSDSGLEMVERLLWSFLNAHVVVTENKCSLGEAALAAVTRLVDGYLVAIAPDPELQPHEFIRLARVLPSFARIADDDLYRAVDLYIEAHSMISKSETKSLWKLVACERLSLEACAHIAQNPRFLAQLGVSARSTSSTSGLNQMLGALKDSVCGRLKLGTSIVFINLSKQGAAVIMDSKWSDSRRPQPDDAGDAEADDAGAQQPESSGDAGAQQPETSGDAGSQQPETSGGPQEMYTVKVRKLHPKSKIFVGFSGYFSGAMHLLDQVLDDLDLEEPDESFEYICHLFEEAISRWDFVRMLRRLERRFTDKFGVEVLVIDSERFRAKIISSIDPDDIKVPGATAMGFMELIKDAGGIGVGAPIALGVLKGHGSDPNMCVINREPDMDEHSSAVETAIRGTIAASRSLPNDVGGPVRVLLFGATGDQIREQLSEIDFSWEVSIETEEREFLSWRREGKSLEYGYMVLQLGEWFHQNPARLGPNWAEEFWKEKLKDDAKWAVDELEPEEVELMKHGLATGEVGNSRND